MTSVDVYKTDIFFGASATGDLDSISGLRNLKESILRRIITVPGSLAHQPSYGAGAKLYVNALNSLQKQRDLALKIQEQCEQDERVVKVTGVGFKTDSSNTSMVEIKVGIEAVGIGAVDFVYQVGDLP